MRKLAAMSFDRASFCIWTLVLVVGTGVLQCSAAETIPLRIMTFNAELLNAPGVTPGNLQKYRFDYARNGHIERVANLIETLNPDVLNLLEITSKEAVDAIVEVLHEKGLTEYHGYHVDSNDTFTGLDVAVITKLPLDEIDGKSIRTFFSKDRDPKYRRAFRFKGREGRMIDGYTSLSRNSLYFLTVGGHKLALFGLHLKAVPDDEYSNAKRGGEAEIVRQILRAEVVPRGYLPIVLGDLNDYDPDVPDRDETRDPQTTVLKDLKDFDPDRPGPELVNAATKIVRQEDRYTNHWDWNENGADDPQDVYTMIDHILLPQELMPYVTRAFICHSIAADVSDHHAVVVDLALPKQGSATATAR
jgi:exonuclease III